jgi:hypothetical protein
MTNKAQSRLGAPQSRTARWLAQYRGGWQVMFPNAGAECELHGHFHPVHGEACQGRVEVRDRSPNSLVIRVTTRQRLVLERRLRVRSHRPIFTVEDRIWNESDKPHPYVWGQHPAFAATPGMHIDLPAGEIRAGESHEPDADLVSGSVGQWPVLLGRDGRPVDISSIPAGPVERVCYLPDRRAGWAALRDPSTKRGIAVAWDTTAYPHLWLWQQIGGRRFPFDGRAKIVAIEPVSCWPSDGLANAVHRGQARILGPASSATAWMTVSMFDAEAMPVLSVSRAGRVTTSGIAGSPEAA